jgi:hypothetical protein
LQNHCSPGLPTAIQMDSKGGRTVIPIRLKLLLRAYCNRIFQVYCMERSVSAGET